MRGPVRAIAWTILLIACDPPADPAWIAERLAETHERDTAARAAHASDDERTRWTLELIGPDGRTEALPFPTLAALPRTEVTTSLPDEAADDDIVHFSGIRIADLVHRTESGEHAPDVTLVASDGFRATLQMEDVRLFPMMLAMDADGAPLGRDHGGPLYSVLPITQYPDLAQRYTSSSWVFYVTHVIVGTPPAILRIGDRDVGAADLDSLPTTTLSAVVGYRTGWPSEPVVLHGVRVRDVLAFVGITPAETDRIRVMSRALITRNDDRPTYLTGADVLAADVILATSYGESHEPIPSRLGGPMTLAFPASVAEHLTDHDWLTFVNELAPEPAP
jgi:hypothetical protein